VTVAAGTRLGVYEVTALIGQGGMGEVYRARDTKLARDVALKILTDAFALDAERIARFKREAQVLASLNHPNIGAIYGFEDGEGVHALVLELVDGPTLADRIAQGPMPIDEALPIAKQIAEALEAAHEQGIIHRDLKPANIKVRADGTVKVLDFGLAKLAEPPSELKRGRGTNTMSPTLAMPVGTTAGVILGTAAYMAPEQAAGKPIDRRVDVWAFGVILWEMVTGRRLFDRDGIAVTLAAVLTTDIPLGGLPRDTPEGVRRLLTRCLDRNPRTRLRDIGEARVALTNPETFAATTPRHHYAPSWAIGSMIILGLVAVIAVAVALWIAITRRASGDTPSVVFGVSAPAGVTLSARGAPAISPDGRQLLFVAGTGTHTELWIRDLDAATARALPGTEGASYPFWSPDGHHVAYFTADKLKRIEIARGTSTTICEIRPTPQSRGGSWSTGDVIVFAPVAVGGLMRVSASGGTPVPVTTVNRRAGEVAHRYPWFLPDGQRFLYSVTDAETTTLYVGELGSSTRRPVAAIATNVVFAPPDRLVYLRGRTLVAQHFDVKTAQLAGDAIPLADQIDYTSDNLTGIRLGHFSVSQAATTPPTLVYEANGHASDVQLTLIDRAGASVGTIGDPGDIRTPVMSPDRRMIADARLNPQNGLYELWLHTVERNSAARFAASPNGNSIWPVWSPNGDRVAFLGTRNGVKGVFQRSVNGATAEELLLGQPNALPTDWSRDGRFIIYQRLGDAQTSFDVWILPLDGNHTPYPYVQTDASERRARLSPNGKWLAYASTETGREEIFVQSFPTRGGKWPISTDGGLNPVWRRDGRELFFMDSPAGNAALMSVDVGPGPDFEFGSPKVLFRPDSNAGLDAWFDVVDDQRFLMTRPVATGSNGPITVAINWQRLSLAK
jgi:Tol biopolymer transport system component